MAVFVAQIMGMPISLHLRGTRASAATAATAAFDSLREADAVFSTYRADSAVSRLNRGDVLAPGTAEVMSEVIARCEEARLRTGGRFDAHLPAPGGGRWFDPSGLVKGWAVERAAAGLVGFDFCLNAGGDVIVGTTSTASPPWRVGIEDPHNLTRVVAVVAVRDGAVATSGTAHRGAHILDPSTGQPAAALKAVTVAGPSLMWADIYATAAFVEGAGALDWIRRLPGYDGLAIALDGSIEATPGLRETVLPRIGGFADGAGSTPRPPNPPPGGLVPAPSS